MLLVCFCGSRARPCDAIDSYIVPPEHKRSINFPERLILQSEDKRSQISPNESSVNVSDFAAG